MKPQSRRRLSKLLELRQQEVGVEGGWHIGKAQGLGGVQEESSDDEAPVAEQQDICGG